MSFADLNVSSQHPASYEGLFGGTGTSDGTGASLVLRYVSTDDSAEQIEVIATHNSDRQLEWSDPDGVQDVAQAILRHFTGKEPDQALLEALTMAKGDDWTAHATWTLTLDELREIV